MVKNWLKPCDYAPLLGNRRRNRPRGGLPIFREYECDRQHRDFAGDAMEFMGLIAVVGTAETLEALGVGGFTPRGIRVYRLDAGHSVGDNQMVAFGFNAMLF